MVTGSFPRKRHPLTRNVSQITHCCGYKPCARAPDSRCGCLARRNRLADMSQQSPFIPSPVLTAPAFLEATAGENILLPIALDGTDGVPAHSSIAITGLPQGSTLSKGRPFGDTGWKLERDEIGDLQLVLPSSARGQAKLTIQLVAPDATLVADAETVLQVATASQSLPRNAEDTNDAPLGPANQEPALFGMPVSGVTPEVTDAQVRYEFPEEQPDLGLRDAKPSAAVTEQKKSLCRQSVGLCNRSVAHRLNAQLLMLARMRSRPRSSSTYGKGHRRQQR